MSISLRSLVVALAVLSLGPAAAAQPAVPDRPTVAVECPGYVPGCDTDFFQTEIGFARFVRDQGDADVLVLVSSQETGGGGRRYELTFSGRRRLAGRRDTLVAQTAPAASDDAQRRALLSRLRLGLVGFAARTAAADQITVAYAAPAATPETPATPERDPWNAWVFRTSVNGFFNGQQQTSSSNVNGSVSASRVTEALKVSVRPYGNFSRSTFELSSGETFVNENASYGVSALGVRSLSAHWSAGATAQASRSSFQNYDLRARIGPAVEYNVYPYAESTRRQLRFRYGLGPDYAIYADTTLFGFKRELNLQHALETDAEYAQPWGSVDVGVEVSQFLTRPDQYRAQLSGGVDVRVVRGLSVRLNGFAALVRDQINLPLGDATDEDVLTRQRELATGYEYFASVGLSYTFGSIYNRVVNVRFD